MLLHNHHRIVVGEVNHDWLRRLTSEVDDFFAHTFFQINGLHLRAGFRRRGSHPALLASLPGVDRPPTALFGGFGLPHALAGHYGGGWSGRQEIAGGGGGRRRRGHRGRGGRGEGEGGRGRGAHRFGFEAVGGMGGAQPGRPFALPALRSAAFRISRAHGPRTGRARRRQRARSEGLGARETREGPGRKSNTPPPLPARPPPRSPPPHSPKGALRSPRPLGHWARVRGLPREGQNRAGGPPSGTMAASRKQPGHFPCPHPGPPSSPPPLPPPLATRPRTTKQERRSQSAPYLPIYLPPAASRRSPPEYGKIQRRSTRLLVGRTAHALPPRPALFESPPTGRLGMERAGQTRELRRMRA